MHPILHRIKAHNGVDYAAKRNTPVKASGDGVVSFLGRQSGYGRTIEIKHGGNIKTLYAHLERFNNKLKVGSKVKQGEVIAFVGDSGQATGPHLHFEFWQGQVRTDPVKVKLPSAKPVNKNQIEEFRSLLDLSLKKLSEYNPTNDE
jgi:murein DD-endopeptidase MepM/ murein hydrolase activator NlpD